MLPGGVRSPAEHPELAAWRVLLRSRHGELGAVVGPCDGCGMPLVATGLPSQPWALQLPGGSVVVAEQIDMDGGSLSEEQLTARMEAAYKAGIPWSQLPSLAVTLSLLLAIGLAMAIAMAIVSVFMVGFFGET